MPPFTILKISRASERDVEVLGEFATEDEANAQAEQYRMADLSNAYDYIVERPPRPDDLKRIELFTPPL